jgi:predicted nucleic acid-binding protein
LSFDLAAALRRLKPERRRSPLTRRPDEALAFAADAPSAGPGLLLDTNVYIDALQGRLPMATERLLETRQNHHSSVAIAELVHLFGRLDPKHPDTTATLAQLSKAIAAVPSHRLTAPSVQAMGEAGIIAGTIARLRSMPKSERQPLLNDAMLYQQALETGWVLLTRNLADFDIIQQLVPGGRVLFYRQEA